MRKILKKKNLKYYLIYYLILEVISKGNFTIGIIWIFVEFLKTVFTASDFNSIIIAFILLLIVLVIYAIGIIVAIFPVTLFLLAWNISGKIKENEDKKYTSRKDITYYRDKLKGISPATISLLINLNVEETKDITATTMKLQLNKNIAIKGDTIKIISDDLSNLAFDERYLFHILEKGDIERSSIEQWKWNALEEAKRQGYIKEKASQSGMVFKKIMLFIILALFIFGAYDFYQNGINQLESIQNSDLIQNIPENASIFDVAKLEGSNSLISPAIEGIKAIICIVGIIGWPFIYLGFTLRYKKGRSLKRTIKGEELTDEILGLKRFIHDFSNLNDVEKESIIVWDEFLIYAIVLEENEKIIDEIINLKKIEPIKMKRFGI